MLCRAGLQEGDGMKATPWHELAGMHVQQFRPRLTHCWLALARSLEAGNALDAACCRHKFATEARTAAAGTLQAVKQEVAVV